MFSELLMQYFSANQNTEVMINRNNAATLGIDYDHLQDNFSKITGKVFTNDESIRLRFYKEGNSFDFSTFDDYAIRIPLNSQSVAPNKIGDDKL